MRRINLLQPTYDEQTKKELLDVLDSGWVQFGAKTREFEAEFAKYVGAKYAIATNSATSALDLCLKVYGIKGGELITPAFTFVSDAIVGEWNDMDVTFADIDPYTFCIDPKSLVINKIKEGCCELCGEPMPEGEGMFRYHGYSANCPKPPIKNTEVKAIIAVDCHGRLADIEGIREACEEAGREDILIIEDAAHAMYTPGVGKGDIVVYSFQAVKTMPIFDGGMITTNDEAIYKKLRTLTWLGVEKLTYDRVDGNKYTWDYDITQGDGIKAYMTDVQAVLGLGQMRRLEETNARRRQIQDRYNNAFRGKPWFSEPAYSHTVQYYTPGWEDRDGLSQFLGENGIHTSVHFKPLSEMTYWKKAVKNPLPHTEIWKSLLSLPVHNALTDDDQDYVISKVYEYYGKTA